jgi:site-specific DNA-methyltransferase (adenine-specific)
MMSDIEIKCGDSINLLKELPPNSVNLIVADPPYNLGKDYGNNHDLKGFDDYLDFTRQWTAEAKRVLSEDGTMYVFMGVRFISYLYGILDKEQQLYFSSWVVWHYTQGLGKTKGFSPRHDDILVFNKSKKFKFNLDDVRVPQKYYRAKNNMRGANPGDVWKFSHVHYSNPNRQNHPTQKPEGLIERMVLASSDEGDTVLDPFSGSGTTLRVCQQLNRKGIGFELNPEYVEMTKDRLSEPFKGFDSVDPRMERVPNDLRKPEIRDEYLANHINWFLSNHENAIDVFIKAVKEKYGVTIKAEKETYKIQDELF